MRVPLEVKETSGRVCCIKNTGFHTTSWNQSFKKWTLFWIPVTRGTRNSRWNWEGKCYELPVSAGMGTESKVSGAEVSGGNLETTEGAHFWEKANKRKGSGDGNITKQMQKLTAGVHMGVWKSLDGISNFSEKGLTLSIKKCGKSSVKNWVRGASFQLETGGSRDIEWQLRAQPSSQPLCLSKHLKWLTLKPKKVAQVWSSKGR